MKKSIAFLLTVIIAFGCIGIMNVQEAEAASSDDVACYGVYYQERVTELSVLRKLRKADFDDDGHTEVDGIKYARSGDYYYKATPIEWNIVGSDGGCYVLFSKYVLFDGASNGSDFYSGGSLRRWLNSTFLDIAFTSSEKDYMGKGYINYESDYPLDDLESNPYSPNLSGNLESIYMDDYVTIPTKQDILLDFKNGSYETQAYATEFLDENRGLSQYWLRGPAYWYYGNPSWYYVGKDGSIGNWYGTWGKGIRPVIKVKKNSPYLIKGKSGDLSNLNLNEFTFTAYDKDSFIDVETYSVDTGDMDQNHKVNYFKLDCGSQHFASPKNDNVLGVPYSNIGTTAVKLYKDDYRDFLIPEEVTANWRGRRDTFTAYMQRDKHDGKPYVSSVFGRNSENNDAYCEMQTETLSTLDEGKKSHIIISAVGAQEGAMYYLVQDSHRISPQKTPEFDIKLAEKFDEDKDTFVYFVNPDGTRSDPVKINIDLKRYTEAAKKLLKLKSFSLLGKSGLGLKMDDSSPIMGGVELGLEAFTMPLGVEYEAESQKLKISLGLDLFKYSNPKDRLLGDKEWTETKDKNDRWSVFKNEIKSVKDQMIDKNKAREKIDDLRSRYDPSGSRPNSITTDTLQSKSFSFDTSFLGYLEFQFVEVKGEDGKNCVDVYLMDGDAAFNLSLEVSRSFQTFAGPGFPTYGYVEFGFDTKVGVKFSKIVPEHDFPVETGWYVNLEPKAKVGYGAGFKGYLSAGVYGGVNVPILFDSMERRTTVKLKGTLGFEGEAFLLNFDWPIFEGEAVLVDKYWDSSGGKKSSGVAADSDIYTVNARKAELCGYIGNTSDWLPGTEDTSVSSAADGTASVQTLQSSVYPYSNAKLVSFGDKLMAVWMEDDKTRGDINRARLVYSVCDSGRLDWSEPKPVDDNGRMDYYPSVISDGSNVYLTWQNSNRSFDGASVNIEDVMNSFDLKAAKYNASADSFETVTVAQNDTYDYAQTAVMENGKPVVYWAHNDNRSFDGSGYSVKKYSFDTQQSKTVYSNLNCISGVAACGGEVAYLMDADGNSADASDVYLYVDGSRVTTDEIADEPVTYLTAACLGGKDVFIASVAGGTFTVDGGKPESFTNNTLLVDGNLNVIDCGGKTRLVWTGVKDEKNAVFSAEYGENGICEPVVLAATDKNISNLSAVYSGNAVYAVYNSREYDPESEELGIADFNCLTMNDFTDISVNLPAFTDFDLACGQTAELDVEVTNNGTVRISQVAVKVSDGTGTEAVTNKTVDIAAGESVILSVPYEVPELSKPTKLTVEAIADDDADDSNNSTTVTIGKPEIMLRQMTVTRVGDFYVVSCPFWNNGLTDAEDVNIALSCGEKVLGSTEAGTVPAYSCFVKDYFVPLNALTFTDGKAEITFSAETSSDEQSADNNSQSYIITEKTVSSQIPDEIIELSENQLPPENVLTGDVTGDGKITIDDATMIQKYLAEMVTLTGVQQTAADANGNGSITIDDATMIQKYLAEMIDHLGK